LSDGDGNRERARKSVELPAEVSGPANEEVEVTVENERELVREGLLALAL
jgi:hypothetical protein